MFQFIIKHTVNGKYVNEWSEDIMVKYLKTNLPPHMHPAFDEAWKKTTRLLKEAILQTK